MALRRDTASARKRANDDILALLDEGGCPVCRYVENGVTSWVRAYSREARGDEDIQNRVQAALGFCPPHTRRLISGGTGSWLLKPVFADATHAGLSRVDGSLTTPVARCVLCEHLASDESTAIGLLLGTLPGNDAVATAYRDVGGACLPHVLAMMGRAAPSEGTLMANVLVSALENLDSDLTGLSDVDANAPDVRVALVTASDVLAGHDADLAARVRMRRAMADKTLDSEADAARQSIRQRIVSDLASDRCPVCLAAQRAEWRFLAWTTVDTDHRNDEVWLCGRHVGDVASLDTGHPQQVVLSNVESWRGRFGRHLARIGDRVSAGAYRTSVRQLREVAECRACDVMAIASRRTAALLDSSCDDPSLSEAIDQSHGTCLHHGLADLPSTGRYRRLLRSRLALQAWALDESIRKDGWSTRWDVRGAEMGAWWSAATVLDGRIFLGCSAAEARDHVRP